MNSKVHFSSETDEWATPQELFDNLDAKYHFTLDPCATEQNHKCDTYFTKKTKWVGTKLGGVYRVLQSPLWQTDRQMGRKGKQGKM